MYYFRLGTDSVLIAYDAILGCKGNWNELCLRAMLHGGDNDSTGIIAKNENIYAGEPAFSTGDMTLNLNLK